MTEDGIHGFFVNLLAAMDRQLGALKHLHLTAPAGIGLGPAVMAIEHHLAEARARFDEMTDQPVPSAVAETPEHPEDGISLK